MTVIVNLEFIAKDAVKAVRRGDVIVAIDVLRCSSSITNALSNGAKAVIPTRTLKEAYELRREHPYYLLAGERRGLKPRMFDFGNSPLEFARESVYGETLVFTTTSGTVALVRSKPANWVLIGTFLNAGSVAAEAVRIAEREGTGISLVLSGRKGHFSLEDFICGGAIVERFPSEKVDLSDAAFAALLAFKQTESRICESIMRGEHARQLVELGFKRDIEFACELDLFNIVPVYRDGIITLLN